MGNFCSKSCCCCRNEAKETSITPFCYAYDDDFETETPSNSKTPELSDYWTLQQYDDRPTIQTLDSESENNQGVCQPETVNVPDENTAKPESAPQAQTVIVIDNQDEDAEIDAPEIADDKEIANDDDIDITNQVQLPILTHFETETQNPPKCNDEGQRMKEPASQLEIAIPFTSTSTKKRKRRRRNSSSSSNAKPNDKKNGGKGKVDQANPPGAAAVVCSYSYTELLAIKYNQAIDLLTMLTYAPFPKFYYTYWLNSAEVVQAGTHDYKVIATYVNNSQVDISSFGIKILFVVKVSRLADMQKRMELYTKSGYHFNRHLLWHGTKWENVNSILQHGFVLPNNPYRRLKQGRAIYFADRASKSANFCTFGPTCGNAFLFLCDVALGNMKTMVKPNYDLIAAPEGCESVLCPGKKVPDSQGGIFLENSYVPLGQSVDSRNRNHLDCNVYAIYDPNKIFIQYVVYFQYTPAPFTNPI